MKEPNNTTLEVAYDPKFIAVLADSSDDEAKSNQESDCMRRI